MKLSQTNLSDYFTIADAHSSWHKTPTNTFNFISRDSRTLVVTVGDSWTWGSDISQSNYDDQFRIEHVYGNVIANKVNADWLNLGLSASSNFWATGMVEELGRVIPVLEYDKIYVFCIFTGVGRWFHTQYDRHINYREWASTNITCADDFYKLLLLHNHECVSRISTTLNSFNHVVLNFGTNFVDPIGFDNVPAHSRLARPWYQVMDCADDVVSPICIDGIKALLRMPEVITDAQCLTYFKEWMLEQIPKAEKRNAMLTDSSKFRNYHPLKEGHAQWAEYVINTVW